MGHEYNEVDAIHDCSKLIELLEQWTRAEIMARLGHTPQVTMPTDWCGYWHDKVDLEDKIRQFIFGTSDLVQLAKRFNLPI